MNRLKESAKAVAAFLTALGTWGYTAGADEVYSDQELWGLCGVLVVGITTWAVPNAVRIRRNRGEQLHAEGR